jgi:hypothetical protein
MAQNRRGHATKSSRLDGDEVVFVHVHRASYWRSEGGLPAAPSSAGTSLVRHEEGFVNAKHLSHHMHELRFALAGFVSAGLFRRGLNLGWCQASEGALGGSSSQYQDCSSASSCTRWLRVRGPSLLAGATWMLKVLGLLSKKKKTSEAISATKQELSFVLGQRTVVAAHRRWTCVFGTFHPARTSVTRLLTKKKQALCYGQSGCH